VYKPINPKAVTRNELYGYLHPSTREWKEGLVSVTFRDMANNSTNKHQWIVLDGDIDAGVFCHMFTCDNSDTHSKPYQPNC
jgi:dynein heavy chain